MASFGIIRMQKFKMTDVQGIQKHNQRQGISKSNLDIDYKKSNENYDLMNDGNLKYESEIKQQIGERVKRKTRANSVVLSEFMVTASPEFMESLSAGEQKKYFDQSLDFLQERYGRQNTLYAVVHHDEKTPHMHVGIIPITKDERLSAKDIFNRVELQNLQTEFTEHMQQNNFDIERGKPSDKKHLSPQEYKEKMDLEKEVKSLQQQRKKEVGLINEIGAFNEPKKVLDKVKKEKKKTVLRDRTSLPNSDFEKLEKLALSSVRLKRDIRNLKCEANEKIDSLETSVQLADQRVAKFEKRVNELEKELEGKTEKLDKVQRKEIIYKSMLQDSDTDLNISELEEKGRLIMFNLENGYNPKNVQEGEEWLSVLQENKKSKTIPLNRLEGFLERLKAFLDKTLGKVSQFSLEGLKNEDKEIKRAAKSQKRKSWDMER